MESPLATSTPAAGPSPGFDAQVRVSASAAELPIGDLVTITVTVTNTGRVAFGSMRYQLLGEWEPYLGMTTGAVVEHELDVAPGHGDTATFALEAAQAGVATLQANVTVKTREEPPSIKPLLSEDLVEIAVIGGF